MRCDFLPSVVDIYFTRRTHFCPVLLKYKLNIYTSTPTSLNTLLEITGEGKANTLPNHLQCGAN